MTRNLVTRNLVTTNGEGHKVVARSDPNGGQPYILYIYIYTSVDLCISMHRVSWKR